MKYTKNHDAHMWLKIIQSKILGAKRVSERLLERKMRDNNTGAERVSERLLERKMQNSNAAVGRLSDTTERAYTRIITVNIQEVEPSQGYSIKMQDING